MELFKVKMHFDQHRALLLLAIFFIFFVSTGCTRNESQPFGADRLIPPDNSHSTFTQKVTSEEKIRVLEVAEYLRCTHPLGCSCSLDSVQASCSFVFACIDAGLCECESGCENIGD
ncbi:hypothetical protein SAMN05216326_1323 [Nitrosomonas marina]|uniref:Uncharacterized protein n=1 Tax=Nitrosomonas marina TaxID=917 RepID=A0A1I0F058_9PROT|nr:hypothetical protein SAMN05216326_1323 [Nitrosomonas marina]